MTTTNDVRTSIGRDELVVRAAVPADYSAVRAVLFDAYRQYVDVVPRRIWPHYLSDLLDLKRHAGNGQLVVAEVAGRIRGSAAFYPDTSVQGLGWPSGWAGGRGLGVHPEARGQGVARALIAECERLARAAGAPVFAFHSAAFMASAVALYERLGYQRAPEFDLDLNRYYGVTEGPTMTIIAYRLDLECSREQPWGVR